MSSFVIQKWCGQDQPHDQHTWVYYGPNTQIGLYANCAGYTGYQVIKSEEVQSGGAETASRDSPPGAP